MGREREASRAPPGRAAAASPAFAASARRTGLFSPGGLQSRFGNQGAQIVLRALVNRNADVAPRPTAAPQQDIAGKRPAPAPTLSAPAQPVPIARADAAPAAPAANAMAMSMPVTAAASVAPQTAPAPAPDGKVAEAPPPAKGPASPVAGAAAAPAASPATEAGEGGAAAVLSPAAAVAPVAAQVRKRAHKARDHSTADPATRVAQAAGKTPLTEQTREAARETVAAIATAETKPVKSFHDRLREALDATLPKPTNADDAKRAMDYGAEEANATLSTELGKQTTEATGGLPAAADPKAEVPADTVTVDAAVTLVPEAVGPAPAPVAAGAAIPPPAPAPDFSEDRAPTDRAMADAGVTEQQMARSNEPEFTATLQARKGAEREEAQRVQQFTASQSGILNKQHGQTAAMLSGGLATMQGVRGTGLGLVAGQQTTTKSAEAKERERVTGLITGIKNKTRDDVLQILADMEDSAKTSFASGLGKAETAYNDAFEDHKGGAWNWLTNWGDDWKDLINSAFVVGRAAYDKIVSQTIDDVAFIIEGRLALAKARVERGRKEVDDFVAGLEGESKRYGDEARTQIGAEFDALDGDIDAKRDEMVTQLADQYRESQKRVAAMEEKLREANKSLWERIYDATVGIIKKIIAFKDFLLNVLARVGQVVSAIIDDPIGFLGNLIDGIMAGLDGFQSRIGEHLKKGLLEWLFGAIEGAGIKLPEKFDLKGVVGLVLQILGLTWENIRARAVKVLGADTVAYLEKSWEIFQVLIKEGPGGLWKMLVEKIGDIKDMVIAQVGQWVEEKIITAGIKWVLSLLNPVAAFIKACMAIYDIVKFFIDRAAQIAALINAILDTLGAIVRGNLTAMATAVEGALARMIPVAIGFLASLLGLGGISDAIRNIIKTLQAPVNAAIDWIIGKAWGLVKKAGGFLAKKAGGAVDKVIKATDKRTPEEKQRDLDRAAKSLRPLINPLLKRGITPKQLKPLLLAWRLRYRLTSLTLDKGEIVATINPTLVLAKGWEFNDADIFKIIDKIAGELVARADPEVEMASRTTTSKMVTKPWGDRSTTSQEVEQIDISRGTAVGRGTAALLQEKKLGKKRTEVTFGRDHTGAPLTFGHSPEQAPMMGWFGVRGIASEGIGPKGRFYDPLRQTLKGKPVGEWLDLLMRGKPLPPEAQPHKHELEELYGLLLAKEPSHRQRDLVYSVMAIDLMQGPDAKPIEAVVGTGAMHPAAFGGAQEGARGIESEMQGKKGNRPMRETRKANIEERRRRESLTLQEWFKKHQGKLKPIVGPDKPTLDDVEEFVRRVLNDYLAGGAPAETAPVVPTEGPEQE